MSRYEEHGIDELSVIDVCQNANLKPDQDYLEELYKTLKSLMDYREKNTDSDFDQAIKLLDTKISEIEYIRQF